MQTIFHNILIALEEPWYYWNICMELLTKNVRWDTLGTIILWAWSIMLIWKMHLRMTCWDKLIWRSRTSWWFSLVLVGKIFETLREVQEHILSFNKAVNLIIAHKFQEQFLNQVQKLSTMNHVLQEWLHHKFLLLSLFFSGTTQLPSFLSQPNSTSGN